MSERAVDSKGIGAGEMQRKRQSEIPAAAVLKCKTRALHLEIYDIVTHSFLASSPLSCFSPLFSLVKDIKNVELHKLAHIRHICKAEMKYMWSISCAQ